MTALCWTFTSLRLALRGLCWCGSKEVAGGTAQASWCCKISLWWWLVTGTVIHKSKYFAWILLYLNLILTLPSALISHLISYFRIGPVGFLCLGEEKIPGNAGVKDVMMALRWVRDNIPAFQGNPYKVVVAGQGFGAAMVEALLLSPIAQGLFHGAIMQSGSVLCPWVFNHDAKDRGVSLLQLLNDNDETLTLLNADVNQLAEKSDKIYFSYLPFGICIEKEFKNEDRLISESPYRLASNKFTRRVPLIIGYNTDEAYIFLSILKGDKMRKKMTRDTSILLPDELKFLNENELKTAEKQIKDLYFKNNFTLATLLAYHR